MLKASEGIRISPSIIAADLSAMGAMVSTFDKTAVDLLHMDVMDGKFVPNLTFGPGYIKALMGHTDIPMDVHLMIDRPEDSLESYLSLKPWGITIHYESTRFPARILSKIAGEGIIAGLAINPATPVDAIADILPYTGLILIMSVDPGFYGQTFMEPALGRISRLRKMLLDKNLPEVLIQVDGGIGESNIAAVAAAGATVIVAGNAAFKGGDVNGNCARLKKTARG